MTFAVTSEVTLSAPVPNAGTFTMPYPHGASSASLWAAAGHILVDSNGNKYTSGFTVSFDSSVITVTNSSLGALAAGRRFVLQGAIADGVGETALTDAASIATDCATGSVFTVTLGGNRTLANPTNIVNGATYLWIITQDGTGTRTLAYGNKFKWPGGITPVLTTTTGAVDIISAVAHSGNIYGAIQQAFA